MISIDEINKIKDEIMENKSKFNKDDYTLSSFILGSIFQHNNLQRYFSDIYKGNNKYYIYISENNTSIYLELRKHMKLLLIIDVMPFNKLVLELYYDEESKIQYNNISLNKEVNNTNRKVGYIALNNTIINKLNNDIQEFANTIIKTHEDLIIILMNINDCLF